MATLGDSFGRYSVPDFQFYAKNKTDAAEDWFRGE